MDQPGIEVRPIEMISGESEFNEVFYTDARCPKENVLGGVNNGWAVAMSLLGFDGPRRGDEVTRVGTALCDSARELSTALGHEP